MFKLRKNRFVKFPLDLDGDLHMGELGFFHAKGYDNQTPIGMKKALKDWIKERLDEKLEYQRQDRNQLQEKVEELRKENFNLKPNWKVEIEPTNTGKYSVFAKAEVVDSDTQDNSGLYIGSYLNHNRYYKRVGAFETREEAEEFAKKEFGDA